MLVTPGCTAQDRALAKVVLGRAAEDDEPAPRRKRRWWNRRG